MDLRTGEKEQEIIQIIGAVNQLGGGTRAPTPGWPPALVNPLAARQLPVWTEPGGGQY